MNGRTALGACLVLLAVLAGAVFLDRAQRLVPVYAAARDLPAGRPLRNGDLMVVRVRLPATALRHYLRPGPDRAVAGRVLTAPVRREMLVPAELVLASGRQARLVELPVQVEPGDMARGLRPGDSVQVLAAYTEGARRGRAVVLLPAAEVVQVLEDDAGLAGIFVVKAPAGAADPALRDQPPPTGVQEPPPGTSGPLDSAPDAGQSLDPSPDVGQPLDAPSGTGPPEPDTTPPSTGFGASAGHLRTAVPS
jgi:hypothetical protein